MEKVYEVVKEGNEYFLQEVDMSEYEDELDFDPEDEDELSFWAIDHDYCLGSLPYQFVLVRYPSGWSGPETAYYYNEEHLRDMWEDDLVDTLLKDGTFYDDTDDDGDKFSDGMRFDLFRIKAPKNI